LVLLYPHSQINLKGGRRASILLGDGKSFPFVQLAPCKIRDLRTK